VVREFSNSASRYDNPDLYAFVWRQQATDFSKKLKVPTEISYKKNRKWSAPIGTRRAEKLAIDPMVNYVNPIVGHTKRREERTLDFAH
jgi:hypothetical protein